MPLTPFHLGPALLLGLIFRKRLELAPLLISSVAPDIEPLLVMILNLNYPLHGFLHTYLGGSLLAVLLHFSAERTKIIKASFISSLLGVYSHILLDSFLYYDITPFFPLEINPFLHRLSFFEVYAICSIMLLIAALLLVSHKYAGLPNENEV